jgi:FkbM family methyltransferase
MQTLRYALKRQLRWLRLPVRSGPLRGLWISVFCGMRFIRGRYDRGGVAALSAFCAPGMVVYDIGAHVGYLSMVAARRVGATGQVIAFEPLQLNLAYLRGHVQANALSNVRVVDACVGATAGEARFDTHRGTGRGRVSAEGGRSVRAVSLDDEVSGGRLPPPALIKMDIEGAELAALQGARATLRTHRPVILLSTHGAQVDQACQALLEAIGYRTYRTKKNQLTAVWAKAPVPTVRPGECVAA